VTSALGSAALQVSILSNIIGPPLTSRVCQAMYDSFFPEQRILKVTVRLDASLPPPSP
jgi:hypothetical protein